MSMDDGLLSQDDIDALTAGLGLGGGDNSGAGSVGGGDIDGIKKFLKILSEQASSVVTTVLSRTVELDLTKVFPKSDFGDVHEGLKENTLIISVRIGGDVSGHLDMLINKKAVAVLADLMLMGGGTAEYSEEHKDAIQEIVNQIFGSFTSTVKTELSLAIESSPTPAADLAVDLASYEILGDVTLHVEEFPDQPVYWLMDQSLTESLSAKLVQDFPGDMDTNLSSLGIDMGGGGQASNFTNPQQVTAEISESASGSGHPGGGGNGFSSFGSTGNKALDLLMDIELPITIELGRTRISLKRVLELGPGAIVEMERFAGEPVDILINEKVVAKGEVVVVDENFGVRVVALVTPEERIKMLR